MQGLNRTLRLLFCLNAVLHDYARLGLLLTHNGHWRGQQLIPHTWIEDATRVHPAQAHLQPGTAKPFFGYGYQVWIFLGERRMSVLLGVCGQALFVDPASRLVMDRGDPQRSLLSWV